MLLTEKFLYIESVICLMAYTPEYTSSDVAPITFDLLGQFMAALTGQAGTLAEIIVLGLIIALVGGFIAILLGIFSIGPLGKYMGKR